MGEAWRRHHRRGAPQPGDPTRRGPFTRDGWAVPRAVSVVGGLATLVGCGGPLVMGLSRGWSLGHILGYSGLAFFYLVLTQAFNMRQVLAPARPGNRVTYFLMSGLVCLLLQISSGDPYLQPIVFTAPLAGAALIYERRQTLGVALYYLLLMALGLWLSHALAPDALLLPLFGYATLMTLILSFTRVLAGQAAARRRADQLATDLAVQRDYLARLVELTATLTRNLDLGAVLEQVAAAGQALARAAAARVWLAESAAPAAAGVGPLLRLGAAVPAPAGAPPAPPPLAARVTVTPTSLVLPLVFQGHTIGVLELDSRADAALTDADARLLQPFADTAAVAIQNARLYEQAGHSFTLAERNRLARELHDTIAQGLTAVTMHLEAAERSFDRYPDRARARVTRAAELARETLADVRRSVWTLAAPLTDGAALQPAIEDLVRRFAARTGVAATYTHHGPPPPLDHAAATQAVRILQELLLNVEKHAQASTVAVQSETGDGVVRISVCDDGTGFAPAAPLEDGGAAGGFGLFSVQERARLVGGGVQIASAPGAGTQITLTMPGHAGDAPAD